MYQYTPANAKTYNTLGIEGTTYQLAFDEVSNLLGDLHGKVALDFGTGTGRTARLLHALRAEKVYGVDHNQTMIDQATLSPEEGIDFMKVDGKLPFNQDSLPSLEAGRKLYCHCKQLSSYRQSLPKL